MAKVTERCFEATGDSCFICDFSPPRHGDPNSLTVPYIPSDFIAVAYLPGRAVRTNSAMLASSIKQQAGRDVTFTLATRDMNKLAIQSLLLGAQLLGLENVIVVEGDPFGPRDQDVVKRVADFTPTGLIAAAASMNVGVDFRGGRLRAPTDFCIGAALDLDRDLRQEAWLAHRKFEAGAQFFITQPVFGPGKAEEFLNAYKSVAGEDLDAPVFYGLAILAPDGVVFSRISEQVRLDLEQGRSGMEIAAEQYESFAQAGMRNVYLVPPIRRGGARDYGAARAFLTEVGRT